LPHLSNGENLNAQIDYAIRERFDLFFRVDGDDTVTAQRFVQQAAHLCADRSDIVGAGLRYHPDGQDPFVMTPRDAPGPIDYLENSYVLPPTMAFRVAAIAEAGPRYWDRRIEDKHFLYQALGAGLRVANLPLVAGDYTVHPGTRNRLSQKTLGLRLNFAFLWRARAMRFAPYAAALFALHVTLGPQRLRSIRYLLHRKKTAPHRDFGSGVGTHHHDRGKTPTPLPTRLR